MNECEIAKPVNLEQELNSNARVMSTSSVLDDIGVQLQAGRRTDIFWIALAIIASGVLISISIFGKRRRRRRR